LLSYVIAIVAATTTVPRYVAFEVFLGLDKLNGNVSAKFIVGIHSALIVAMIVLIFASIASFATSIKLKSTSKETAGYK